MRIRIVASFVLCHIPNIKWCLIHSRCLLKTQKLLLNELINPKTEISISRAKIITFIDYNTWKFRFCNINYCIFMLHIFIQVLLTTSQYIASFLVFLWHIWVGLLQLMECFWMVGIAQTTSMVKRTTFLESTGKVDNNFSHYLKHTKCGKSILFRKGFNWWIRN